MAASFRGAGQVRSAARGPGPGRLGTYRGGWPQRWGWGCAGGGETRSTLPWGGDDPCPALRGRSDGGCSGKTFRWLHPNPKTGV